MSEITIKMSAYEARRMAGPTAQEHADFIMSFIEKSAAQNHREVIIRNEPYCSWLYNADTRDNTRDRVIAALRNAGYSVDLYYAEFQFVDMGLRIKW